MMDKDTFVMMTKYPGCILDKERRFVFFCHNKVAQTSINRVLLKDRVVVKKDNRIRYYLQKKAAIKTYEADSPFCFTIVRNPYDRVVSAFNYLKKFGKIEKEATFDIFVRQKLRAERENFDRHFMPQCRWPLKINQIGFDFIGYYENLEKDWLYISSHLGIEANLPHANKSEKKPNWQDYYDNETAEIVYALYKKDFSELGYPEVI